MYCNKCSKKILDTAKFCSYCGTSILELQNKDDETNINAKVTPERKTVTGRNNHRDGTDSGILKKSAYSIKNLFCGRIGRKTFVLGYFFIIALLGLIMLIGEIPHAPFYGFFVIVSPLAVIVYFFLTWSLYIRRLHDLDKSGLYTLLLFVPIANLFVIVNILFAKGKTEPNRYGKRVEGVSFMRDLFARYK